MIEELWRVILMIYKQNKDLSSHVYPVEDYSILQIKCTVLQFRTSNKAFNYLPTIHVVKDYNFII